MESTLGYSRWLKELAIDNEDHVTAGEHRDSEKLIIYSTSRQSLLEKHSKLTPEIEAFLLEVAMLDKELNGL